VTARRPRAGEARGAGGVVPSQEEITMGMMYVTNLTGVRAQIASFRVNQAYYFTQKPTLAPGETRREELIGAGPASEFEDLNFNLTCGDTTYHINLNRDHWFGDNDGSYPGSDYDINLVVLGFDAQGIPLKQVYRRAVKDPDEQAPFTYCSDLKTMRG
jgi:hypothetical protein